GNARSIQNILLDRTFAASLSETPSRFRRSAAQCLRTLAIATVQDNTLVEAPQSRGADNHAQENADRGRGPGACGCWWSVLLGTVDPRDRHRPHGACVASVEGDRATG